MFETQLLNLHQNRIPRYQCGLLLDDNFLNMSKERFSG